MLKRAGLLAFAAAALVAPQAALAEGIGAEVTGARASGLWGVELGVGYGLSLGPINVRPIVGGFVHKNDDERYYTDRFSNGQERCRDTTNGRFVSDSRCGASTMFYGKIEATISIPAFAEVGGGGRFMDGDFRPYGLAAFPLAPKVKVVAQGGDRYFSAGLRVGF